MVKNGLYVRLTAKPGKEKELEEFLKSALPLAQAEKETSVWYAVKFSANSFAIFDAFTDNAHREAHLNGKIAAALMNKAEELLTDPPVLEHWDTLAVK